MSSNNKSVQRRGWWAAWLVVLLLGLQLVLAACGDEATPTPTAKDNNLPQDRVLVLSNKDGWPDLYTVDLTGKFVGRVTQSAAAEYSPSWSPDGKRIVFTELNGDEATGDYASNRRIVVVDADGKNRKVMTQDGINPVWSPDSQKILFTRLSGGTAQTNSLGNKALNIAAAPAIQLEQATPIATSTPGNAPTISAEQQTIAAASQGGSVTATPDGGAVSIPNPDDATPTPAVTAKPNQQASLYAVAVDNGTTNLLVSDAVSGSWSPDGKRLVYIGGNNVLDQKRTLNIASADGSNSISLSERAKITDLDTIFASWSPDSASLAFTATDTQKDKISLYRINADSGNARKAADYDGSAHEIMSMIWAYSDYYSPASRLHFEPAWSPNGRSIAFSDGSARIQVVDTSSGNIRFFPVGTASLGQDKDSVLGVSWLPDNRRLVYDRANVGRNTLQSQAGSYIYDFFDETLETLDTVNKNTLTLMSGSGATFQPTCCGVDTLGVGSPTGTTAAASASVPATATAAPTATAAASGKTGKLVYASGIGQRQLIVNDLATGKQTVITSGAFKQIDFNLAPKGNKMVYVEVGDNFSSALYLVDLDGQNKTKISEGSGNPDDLSYLTSWTTDGKTLAFQSLNGDPKLKPGLYAIQINGSVKDASPPRLITTQNASAFAWSPDGSQLAYRVENLTYELYISPADGSSPGKQIASLGNFDTRYSSLGKGLAWSPDGKYLAMSGAAGYASYSSIWDIWLVTPQGVVDDQPGYYINRITGFTPDSNRLIATVASANQSSTIQAFVLASTTNSLRGWRSYDRGQGPSISPDGNNMAYYSQGNDPRFDSGAASPDTNRRLMVLSFINGNTRPINLDYMPYFAYKARFYSWEPGNGQSFIYYQNNSIYISTGQGNPVKSEVLARAFVVDRLGWAKN